MHVAELVVFPPGFERLSDSALYQHFATIQSFSPTRFICLKRALPQASARGVDFCFKYTESLSQQRMIREINLFRIHIRENNTPYYFTQQPAIYLK